jgi:hypothetical protein
VDLNTSGTWFQLKPHIKPIRDELATVKRKKKREKKKERRAMAAATK